MGYTYPDAKEAAWVLMGDPLTEDDIEVTRYFHRVVGWEESLPAGQIMAFPGSEGFLERVDRIGVDFYAEGELAQRLAEAFKVRFAGENRNVEGVGLLDTVVVETIPHDVPYADDRINLSSAVYRVTTRPKL